MMETPRLQQSSPPSGKASVFERMTAEELEYLSRRLHQLASDRVRKDRLASDRARKDRRDAALRELAARLGNWRPTRAAKRIAELLCAYQQHWPEKRNLAELPPDAPRNDVLLHAVMRWNEGRALAWRQIVNIIDECRRG